MMTTVRIMTTSAYDSPSYADVMPEISAAASRIRIIGSFSSSKNRCRLLFFFPAASRFGPCSESRRAASASESPCSVVCNSSFYIEKDLSAPYLLIQISLVISYKARRNAFSSVVGLIASRMPPTTPLFFFQSTTSSGLVQSHFSFILLRSLHIPGSRCIRLRSGRPASGRVPWKCSRSPVRKFPLSFR